MILFFRLDVILCRFANKKTHFHVIALIIMFLGFIINILYSFTIHIIWDGRYDEFLIYIFPIARAVEYICGMGVGICARNKKKSFDTIKEIVTIVGFCAVCCLFNVINIYDFLSRNSIWMIPSCVLLYAFWNSDGGLSRILSKGIFEKIGNLSFEMYLLHYPILCIISLIIPYSIKSITMCAILIIYCLVLTMFCAYYMNIRKH